MSIPDPIVLLDARARYVHPAFQMSRASTKTAFDATGKLVTVPVNAIGWDHDPATGQSRGYLAEPSATNLLLHSNDLTQGAWSKSNLSVSAAAIIGPDGQGMAKIVEDSASTTHHINQTVTISSGQTIAVQCIAKAAERSNIVLQAANASSISNRIRCAFDLSSGTAASGESSGDGVMASRGILALGGGFYLCWISGTLGNATGCNARVWLVDGGLDYQGDGTSGLYLGKLQVEPGTYPTSYIETAGATATRAGDSLVLSDLGDFPWWRSERGTLLVDVLPPLNLTPSNRRIFHFGGTNALYCTINPAGVCFVGSDLISTNINLFGVPSPGRKRLAVSWDDSEVVAAFGGEIVGSRGVSGTLNVSALGVGNTDGGTIPYQGHISRAVYSPARISNADLQSLTAIQE